jgi:hypothetical protein
MMADPKAPASEFKAKDFVDRLNALGLMLSATRFADGSIRLNQWRAVNYYENEAQIKTIWSSAMAASDSRMHDITRYVELIQGRARALHP